jgi:hypothetical protein
VRARRYCPACLAAREHVLEDSGEFSCVRCGQAYTVQPAARPSAGIERCAFCGNRAFFVQKDFDQRVGCLLILLSLGIALFAGWRLGWIWFTPILLATVAVDWALASRIRPVTICYRCDAEYRDGPLNARHRGYDPHVAERYAQRKTLRRMR